MSAPSGDIRATACERRREKERRVKARGVNLNLIGQPINEFVGNVSIRGSTTWNARNQYRMRANNTDHCHCSGCKRERSRTSRRKETSLHVKDVARASSNVPRKIPRPALNQAAVDDFLDMESTSGSEEEYDDGYVDGVMYSYDRSHGPEGTFALDQAVTQAYEQFQTREFTKLLKNEYDMVNESDAEEEFELI